MEKNAPSDDPKDSDTLLEQEPATSKFWSLKQSPEDKNRWKELGIAALLAFSMALFGRYVFSAEDVGKWLGRELRPLINPD